MLPRLLTIVIFVVRITAKISSHVSSKSTLDCTNSFQTSLYTLENETYTAQALQILFLFFLFQFFFLFHFFSLVRENSKLK